MQKQFSRGLMGTSLAALMLGTAAVPASAQRYSIPANTVVRAELDQDLRSDDARRGDRVLARVAEEDTGNFPLGTRFEGTVTEVQRANDNRPAVLDMRFDRAILPNGTSLPIRGELASLSEEDLRRTADGRLESRRRSGSSNFDWKWVGYGAAGGAVLGQIFGGNLLRGGLLGGLGGAIYGYLNRDRDRGDFRDIELSRGTDFGLVLNENVAFDRRPGWRYGRRINSSVAGARDEYRVSDTTRLFVDGQPVNFGSDRPTTINGVAYVPLRPIANAAGWRLNHRSGAETFTLNANRDFGAVRGYTRDAFLTRGGQRFPLSDSPRLVNGEIYVPLEWLSVATGTNVNWNRNGRRINLTTSGTTVDRDDRPRNRDRDFDRDLDRDFDRDF